MWLGIDRLEREKKLENDSKSDQKTRAPQLGNLKLENSVLTFATSFTNFEF